MPDTKRTFSLPIAFCSLVKFILTDILGTIAYYYMATSEVFHRHRLDYPLDVDASKVYSPFNKWMLAAVVVPVVIAASLTVVYLF